MAVLIVLATFAVAFRLIARRLSTNRFGMDDILIIIALIITYGLNGLNLHSRQSAPSYSSAVLLTRAEGLNYGYGKHMITLTEVQITRFAKVATNLL